MGMEHGCEARGGSALLGVEGLTVPSEEGQIRSYADPFAQADIMQLYFEIDLEDRCMRSRNSRLGTKPTLRVFLLCT